jgi:hypothetical protein
VGDVNVHWGALYHERISGAKRSLVRIELSVRNDSNTPLHVPLAQQQLMGPSPTALRPYRVGDEPPPSSIDVPPQGTQTLVLTYLLPPTTRTIHLQELHLDWTVWVGDQPIHERTVLAVSRPKTPSTLRPHFYAPGMIGPFVPYAPVCYPYYCPGNF